MVSFIAESERRRHKVIDETLQVTTDMLRDPSISAHPLGEWAVQSLHIMDSYFYVPNMSGNRIRPQNRHMNDQSIPLFALNSDEEVVLDSSMPTMHARQKDAFTTFAKGIGSPVDAGRIGAVNQTLQRSFSGSNHPLGLNGYPAGTFSARIQTHFEKDSDDGPVVIPRTVEGSPIVLLSTADTSPAMRGLQMIHQLAHVEQMLDAGPIETATLYSVDHAREADARQTTRSIAKVLRRHSTNPSLRRNPLLKK